MPDYKTDGEDINGFLRTFVSDYSYDATPKYMDMLQDISNRARRVLEIDLNDVLSHFKDGELVESIMSNTKRYMSLFYKEADEVMPTATAIHGRVDIFDHLNDQRERSIREAEANGGGEDASQASLPKSVTRRYEVVFLPLVKDKARPLRQIGAANVGKMVTCKGIVVRCTDVKPMCTVATYICNKCGQETFQEITGREFNPINECGDKSDTNACKGQPLHQPKFSKFVKFQEVKLQEPAGDVPQGSVPRTLTVHVKGELTRIIKPGEMVTVSGIYLPVPFTGYKAMRAGLLTQTYLEVMQINKEKQSYEDAMSNPADRERAYALSQTYGTNVYERLAKSIAPEIYGHEDVKKVLLLLMVGGVTKTTDDGMRMRGDLHVCLMGDPGVAKSQLLKQVATISPRSVYTTGKGSSGVGLTAAVQRDPTTGEMVLEGGALVLADKGVCCIDEFDKMEEQDRTAIHEAMEQQTVSIAKGGITTTLNTRATVLAAANPVGGSYDPSLSPEQNINLPAALLSRFDFLWLMLDKPHERDDRMLADHVLKVHRTKNHLGKDASEMEDYESDPTSDEHLPASVVRAYIGMVREFNPCVPEDLLNSVTEIYVNMRQTAEEHQVVTARQLQSILRMAQALARLRLDNFISTADLSEAQRLLTASKASLSTERNVERTDTISAIYGRIAQYVMRRKEEFKENQISILCFSEIQNIVRKSNFPATDAQIKEALREYKELGVWSLAGNSYDIVLEDDEEPELTYPKLCHVKKAPSRKRRRKQKQAEAEAAAAAGEAEAEAVAAEEEPLQPMQEEAAA